MAHVSAPSRESCMDQDDIWDGLGSESDADFDFELSSGEEAEAPPLQRPSPAKRIRISGIAKDRTPLEHAYVAARMREGKARKKVDFSSKNTASPTK